MSLVPPEPIPGLDKKSRRAGCRFRPPLRRTFGFRLEPTGEASSYSRPVLGARGTLKATPPRVQGTLKTLCRKVRSFFGELLRPSPESRLEAHPSARPLDPVDSYADGVSEPVREPVSPPDECGRERVQLEIVPG